MLNFPLSLSRAQNLIHIIQFLSRYGLLANTEMKNGSSNQSSASQVLRRLGRHVLQLFTVLSSLPHDLVSN